MKQNLHPKWNHQATVKCACGNSFVTGSAQDLIEVDICSKCHPFFTGEMKFVDRQGRVDKFMQKMNLAQQKQASKAAKKKADAVKTEVVEVDPETNEPPSYKQILQREQTKLKQAAKQVKAA